VCARRGNTDGLSNVPLLIGLFINVYKNTALQRKGNEIDTFLLIATGKWS
jgi:hypothetical protein